MKLSFAASMILVLGAVGSALGTPKVPPPAPSPAPSQAPSEPATAADTFVGRIDKARFVHGLGWASKTDMGLAVTASDGKEMFFYLRENSAITDANGKVLSSRDRPRLLKKNVEITYAVITDATGNLDKIENGKNGVVAMHFLDWTAGSQ